MNLDFLNDRELLDHLRNYSTDPIMLRLVTIAETNFDLKESLMRLGFDEHLEIEGRDIASHISYLENEISYLTDDRDELEKEVYSLSTKTVISLIEELRTESASLNHENRRIRRDLETTNKQLADTKEKLKAWDYLRKS